MKKEVKKEDKFSKNQIVKSEKYADYADFLVGNLADDKVYALSEVDELINNNYGKRGIK